MLEDLKCYTPHLKINIHLSRCILHVMHKYTLVYFKIHCYSKGKIMFKYIMRSVFVVLTVFSAHASDAFNPSANILQTRDLFVEILPENGATAGSGVIVPHDGKNFSTGHIYTASHLFPNSSLAAFYSKKEGCSNFIENELGIFFKVRSRRWGDLWASPLYMNINDDILVLEVSTSDDIIRHQSEKPLIGDLSVIQKYFNKTFSNDLAGKGLFQWGRPYNMGVVPKIGMFESIETVDGKEAFPTARIRMRMFAQPGDSGGPVFDNDNHLIGILLNTPGILSGIAYAAPINKTHQEFSTRVSNCLKQTMFVK